MASGRWMYQKEQPKKASYNGMNMRRIINAITILRERLKQF